MNVLHLIAGNRSGLLVRLFHVAAYSIVFVLVAWFSLRYFSKINGFRNTPLGQPLVLTVAFLAGLAFYYVKSGQPFWHGIAVTIFAIAFTFISIKTIVFKIAVDQIYGTSGIRFGGFGSLKPILYLLLIAIGISDMVHGWNKPFLIDILIKRWQAKLSSAGYGRTVVLSMACLTIIPAYYSIYLTFLDDPVSILKRESYVREATNGNDHPRITEFNQAYHILPADASYCGTSIEWAVKEAGWDLDVEYPPRARNWAKKQQHVVWSQNGGMAGRMPARNDVVVCFDKGNWHVGLLEDWLEGAPYCKTVEANTTDKDVESIQVPVNREGIYQGKLRNKKDIYCVVRPYHFPVY